MPYLGDESPPLCYCCLVFFRALHPLFSLCYPLPTDAYDFLCFYLIFYIFLTSPVPFILFLAALLALSRSSVLSHTLSVGL